MRPRKPRRREDAGISLRCQRGAALVEFAIVFPVQLMITLGLIQLSLIYVAHGVVNYAAFQACREVLAFSDDSSRPVEVARTICRPLFGTNDSPDLVKNTTVRVLSNPTDETGDVIVEVGCDLPLIFPIVGNLFEGTESSSIWLSNREKTGVSSMKYALPTIRITKRCVLFKPWR